MKRTALVATVAVGGLLLPLGFAGAAEPPVVADAFSRLDVLAEELAEDQRLPGETPGSPPASVSAPQPEPAPTPEAVGGGAHGGAISGLSGGARDETPCGTAKETEATIAALQERYEEHGRGIIGANDKLPSFRGAVLDDESICEERLAEEISATFALIDALELAVDYRAVDALTVCVDRLRKETDEEISATASNIRMRRLAAEMERLGTMTHRVSDLERAFLRGISKRDRLVEEFGQFQREIEAVCQ